MRRLLFWPAIFILGALTGAALTSVLIGDRIDSLYIENRFLQNNLLTAEKQVKQLQESSKPVKKRVISNINTHVEFDEKANYADFEKSTLELNVQKNVHTWLGIILGQSIDEFNCLLIPNIIDNREIECENKRIRLKVKLAVISETVNVYIKAIPVNSKE